LWISLTNVVTKYKYKGTIDEAASIASVRNHAMQIRPPTQKGPNSAKCNGLAGVGSSEKLLISKKNLRMFIMNRELLKQMC
jgi:hypothetical protein